MKQYLLQWFRRPVFRQTKNTLAKIWVIIGALCAINFGYRLATVLAYRSATPAQLVMLIFSAVFATVAFAIVWFSLHQGSRTLIKNCTFTNCDTGLRIDTP